MFRSDVQSLAGLYGWGVAATAFPSTGNMRAWDTSANMYKSGSADVPEISTYAPQPERVALRVSFVTGSGYVITGVGGVGAGNVASTSCATSLR